jgi:hypothetical protein
MARSPGAKFAHNTGLVADPAQFAREHGAASWLYLCGEDFAAIDGGMSYADVERAVGVSANVVSDPPRSWTWISPVASSRRWMTCHARRW